MRLNLLLLSFLSVAASLKCYDGIVSWGSDPKSADLTLKNCSENCCSVAWSMPGTIYSCGRDCPQRKDFVKGEKCESAPVDASWCFCTGPVGQCKPKL